MQAAAAANALASGGQKLAVGQTLAPPPPRRATRPLLIPPCCPVHGAPCGCSRLAWSRRRRPLVPPSSGRLRPPRWDEADGVTDASSSAAVRRALWPARPRRTTRTALANRHARTAHTLSLAPPPSPPSPHATHTLSQHRTRTRQRIRSTPTQLILSSTTPPLHPYPPSCSPHLPPPAPSRPYRRAGKNQPLEPPLMGVICLPPCHRAPRFPCFDLIQP